MSSAHKGSRLLLSGNIVPVDFSTAYLDFNNDTTGIQYGNMISSNTGGIYTMRPYEGKFGGGIAVEDSTSNLISNPMFDNNISGWLNGNLTTPSWNSGFNDIKSNNGYMYITGSSGNGFTQGPVYHGLVSGGTYTVSAYIEGDGMDIYNKITCGGTVFYSGGAYDDYTWSTSNHRYTKINDRGVYRIDITFTTNQGSHSGNSLDYFQPRIGLNGNYINAKVYGYQFENKSFSTSMINGTRSSGIITYPSSIVTSNQGSISCWIYLENDGAVAWKRIIAFSNSGDTNFDIATGTSYLRIKVSSSQIISASSPLPFNQWTHVSCSWGNSGLKLYINGILVNSNASYTSPIATIDSAIAIGCRQDGITHLNGIISDLIICQTQLSDEDIKAIFISNRPLYNPYDYRAIAY